MKLRLITAVTLGGLLFSACVKEEASGVSDGDGMTLSAGLPSLQTRTWLDYASGGSPLKVYWSDGDRINVNGQASLPVAVADGERKREADFQLPDLAAPFNIIYPHEIVKESAYDARGTIAVELPSVQAYDSGSFANGAAVMYGHAQTPDKVTLHNLCAAVRVNIKGVEGIVEAKLFSASEDAPLCGSFRLSPQTGELQAVEGGCELTLDLEEVALNQENGTDFYFAIPAGDYSKGLTFFFTRKSDHMQMQNIWYPKDVLQAGRLYSFNDVGYVPTAKDIETVEEWEEFATAMNSDGDLSKYLYKGGLVRLGADLSADNLTSITKTFPYIFDGNGRTITRTSATSSLFEQLTGEIRNLTLDGELSLSADGAPFVTNICAGARITGCTNDMDVTFNHRTHCYVTGIAAIALRNDTEGLRLLEISNCTNNGKIEGTVDVSSANYNTAIAGIVGDVRAGVGKIVYDVVISGCRNTAPITLSPKSAATDTYGMTACGVGGIIGFIRSAKSITLRDCENSGAISVTADNIVSERGLKATVTAVGGIVGIGTGFGGGKLSLSGLDMTLTDCQNTATIYNCMVNSSAQEQSCNKVYTGGLAGALVGKSDNYAELTSCSNTGDIYTYDLTGESSASTPGTCAVAAGLIGFGGHLDMKDCLVNCNIGNGKRPVASWSGVIGFAMRPFTLRESSVYAAGFFQRLITYKLNRAMVAVVPTYYITKDGTKEVSNKMDTAPSFEGSVVENCKIGGLLNTSGTTLDVDDKSEITGLTTKLFNTETGTKNNIFAGSGYGANKNCDMTLDLTTITFWTGN